MSKDKAQTDLPPKRWLTYNAEMPMVLLPIYNFLQDELSRIITDDILMHEIVEVDFGMRKGDYWREMRRIIGDDFKKWNLGANAWYARMLYENIRRIVKSGEERRLVKTTLDKHGGKVTAAFWDDLHEQGCHPTSGVVRNIQREIAKGCFTAIPPDARFIMDYSNVSDAAIMKEIAPRRWLIRTGPNTWLDMSVKMPKNLRAQATGKISKPRFVRRKSDDEYVSCISYEIQPDPPVDGENILGNDLGKVKPFSAVSLSPDGIVGDEWIVAHRTQHLIERYELVQESLSILFAKQEACRKLGPAATGTLKYERREQELFDTQVKLRQLKDEIVNFIALDIVLCALEEDCGEVHAEYLSWMDSLGGSWSHSEVQSALMRIAPIYGLRVYRVNATHSSTQSPFSEERGVENGRDIVFSDGWIIDRDFLADVNLASRPVVRDGEKRKVSESLRSRKPRNPKRARRRAKNRKCLGAVADKWNAENDLSIDYSCFLSGGIDVVVFSTGVAGLPAARTVTVPAITAQNENIVSSLENKCIYT